MKTNLDTLRTEIDEQLKTSGFVVFYGFARGDEPNSVHWDVEHHPDYKMFLQIAKQLEVKLIVLHQHAFDASVLDRAVEELEASGAEYDEQRTIAARLQELVKYDGFTCALELSFEHGHSAYVYEARADWFDELNDLLYELDSGAPDDEGEDNEDSYGGYYSKN